jgi:hypothetical protein
MGWWMVSPRMCHSCFWKQKNSLWLVSIYETNYILTKKVFISENNMSWNVHKAFPAC